MPRGVEQIAKKYASKIEAKLGLSVDFSKPLGCGSFGCVYKTSDERRVVKVSVDPTEGSVTKAIIESGLDKKLVGLARFDDLWRIPSAVRRRDAWVILREDIQPLFGSNHPMDRKEVGDALSAYNSGMRRAIEHGLYDPKGPRTESDRRAAENAKELADDALSILRGNAEGWSLAEAIEELAERSIVLADVHMGNVGFRVHDWSEEGGQESGSDSLLIFDPGHSSAQAVGEIAELKGRSA